MRSLPVIIHSPTVFDKKAVRNRMEVPAAPISKVLSFESSALIMTRVSSQSDTFFTSYGL